MSDNTASTYWDSAQFIIDLTRKVTEYAAEHPGNEAATVVRVSQLGVTAAGGIGVGVAVDTMVGGESWQQAVASQATGWAAGVGAGIAISVGIVGAPFWVVALGAAGAAYYGNNLIDGIWKWSSENYIGDLSSAWYYQNDANQDIESWYNDQEYRLPDPSQSNTYRIVWIGGDPLALDLDGDGLETAASNGFAGALFDHNNDGIKTATGWINGDDGLLVRDLNGNGTIDSGAELFGDSTILANGGKARDGFAALRDLDSNGDGIVNATDTAFSELKIWRDTNQDGISQADELSTLAERGIESLNTAAANTSISTSAGQQILTGSFTKTDGTTSALADLNFTQDTFHSDYVDQIEMPEALTDLPNVQGMGKLRDLQEAATLSPALANVLSQYAAAETRTEQKALVDQMLLEWAKTDPNFSLSPVEMISGYNPQLRYDVSSTNIIYLRVGQLVPTVTMYDALPRLRTYANTILQNRTHILDSVYGDRNTNFIITSGSQLANINKSYEAFADAIYADLLTQTRFKKYLDTVELSITDTSISLDTSKLRSLQEASADGYELCSERRTA